MSQLEIENLPFGVEFKFEDYCAGCTLRELVVFNDNSADTKKSIITCNMRHQCKHLNKKLEKRYEKMDN